MPENLDTSAGVVCMLATVARPFGHDIRGAISGFAASVLDHSKLYSLLGGAEKNKKKDETNAV